tara:strand:+ start:22527 stop:23948 length:1422 start_codon:yes stop_codon:yes gene_type:complete
MSNGRSKKDYFSTPFSYYFSNIKVTADRFAGNEYNLERIVSEFSIYEHVDKPFLTAEMVLVDADPNINLLNEIHFMGTETVSVEILTQEDSGFKLKKDFIVTEVTQSIKSNDANEIVLIKLIEDVGYLSSLMRVSRSYTGKKIDIIEQLVKLTGRGLAKQKKDTFNLTEDKLTRVLVPNMTPLEAANWLKDSLHTDEGMPFFLYSTISENDLYLTELNKMLTQDTMFREKFVYSQAYDHQSFLNMHSVTNRDKPMGYADAAFTIMNYEVSNTDDTLTLARKGYTTAEYNFVDTTLGQNTKIDYRMSDTYRQLMNKGILHGTTQFPTYDFKAEFADKRIEDYTTREITHFSTSRQYNDYTEVEGYHEGRQKNRHEQKIISKSLRWWLLKQSIDITVPGTNFFRANQNASIGNKIHLSFVGNMPADYTTDDNNLLDRKKSGEYLIYAARHQFSGNFYTVNLTCAKLGNETFGVLA